MMLIFMVFSCYHNICMLVIQHTEADGNVSFVDNSETELINSFMFSFIMLLR